MIYMYKYTYVCNNHKKDDEQVTALCRMFGEKRKGKQRYNVKISKNIRILKCLAQK